MITENKGKKHVGTHSSGGIIHLDVIYCIQRMQALRKNFCDYIRPLKLNIVRIMYCIKFSYCILE